MVGQEIYNNGKEIYSFVKETNEVNVTEYDQSADSEFSPANIYSIYKKGYKYSYKGEKVVNGVKCDVVELVPSKSGNVKKVEISVNKANKEIKQWKLWDNSGGYTVFDILQFTPNVALADNFFTFNTAKYPGVEVVDLR
jgi:outer membrane lipoprotein-sorting protein